MIVPSDETDSLACPESLPLPQPASAGGSWEEEEVVHVFTTPLQQRQLFRFSVSVYSSPTLSHARVSINFTDLWLVLPVLCTVAIIM